MWEKSTLPRICMNDHRPLDSIWNIIWPIPMHAYTQLKLLFKKNLINQYIINNKFDPLKKKNSF